MELVALDRRALEQASRIVSGVTADHLDRPTPCAGWTLRQLLTHMVSNNHGWAEAAMGRSVGAEVWEEIPLGDDPVRAFQESADRVVETFGAEGFADRRLDVYGYGVFPARVAVGMHFVDFLAHGWDVAKSIGAPDELDPELCEAGLKIALRWPYHRPDKAFGVAVEVPEDAPAHHRLVAYLGRSPGWPAD